MKLKSLNYLTLDEDPDKATSVLLSRNDFLKLIERIEYLEDLVILSARIKNHKSDKVIFTDRLKQVLLFDRYVNL